MTSARTILVTGSAGFIGHHLATKLLERGDNVVGLDNLNDYYDVRMKQDRLSLLNKHSCFRFEKACLEDNDAVTRIFHDYKPTSVVNLAAQAGVRYSLQAPHTYIASNVTGFLNILEACRHQPVEHLVYASSSSVYGSNTKMPFAVQDHVDHPVSLYAATKKSNELMAHTYSHLFGIPTTGLRFFTVYGPWNRPDMATHLFTKAIFAGEPIKVFNHGKMQRDFTYIDDIVAAMLRVIDQPAKANPLWNGDVPDPGTSRAPYKIYNIGNNSPVPLLDFIATIERAISKKATLQYLDMQSGDVPATFADVDDLIADMDFRPSTPIDVGIGKFVEWYRSYYRV